MNIPEWLKKINPLKGISQEGREEEFELDADGEVVRNTWVRRYFVSLSILLISALSFGVGRLTGVDRAGVEINFDPSLLETQVSGISGQSQSASVINSNEAAGESVEASVNGTRYYYAHCGNNIAEKNKVVFRSATEAERAGYTLALNCKR